MLQQRIVVGADGSAGSLDAVRWAARDAARRSAPLHLISTVVVAGRQGVPADLPQTYVDDHERDGNRRDLSVDQVVGESERHAENEKHAPNQ